MNNAGDALASVRVHPFIQRLAKALASRSAVEAAVEPGMRSAAILLILRAPDAGEPELLLIKRAEFESDPWSGHVACPGGRMEADDPDLSHTAIRETREEIDVDVSACGEILGQLDDLSPRTMSLPPLVIRPFVAIVERDVQITMSHEVAAVFWVPLSALQESTAWGRGVVHVRGAPMSVSVFQHGEHTIWGLTERALRQMMELGHLLQ